MNRIIPRRALGKKPAQHDARTYSLAAPLAARLPDVPDVQDWTLNTPYRMWGNDKIGDCAFAAHAALVSAWTKAAQGNVILSDDEVIANYAAVTGYDPKTGQGDNGTVLLQMLEHWRKYGLERPGQTRDYLTGYGAISPKDTKTLKRSICYLGGVLAGVLVPQGFMELGLGETWDITKLSGSALDPVGGHAIALGGFNPSGAFFCTWGQRTFITWRTLAAIGDEAYGLFSRQNWLGTSGLSPKAEDADALLQELRAA